MSYKEDILRLRAEGKTYGEISTILGCSKGTVAYYLKDNSDKTEVAKVKPEVTKTDDVKTNIYAEKIITYVTNYKELRPCVGCGQYLHRSQMDPLDGSDVDKIINSVFDKETLEKSKHKISQLKFICANCDRLRQFKLTA